MTKDISRLTCGGANHLGGAVSQSFDKAVSVRVVLSTSVMQFLVHEGLFSNVERDGISRLLNGCLFV